MTTAAPPKYAPTQTYKSPESRLAALNGYIRDAARHCGDYDRRGLDFEDMVQEATIAVWQELKDYPTAPIGYIWQVAYRAALHVLRSGKSVDSPRTDRRANYQIFSLEALLGDEDRADAFEEALARRKRRGELPDPTQEAAIAAIMHQELWKRLTPRQRQVLDLRLQEYSESEVAAVLGISQVSVSKHVIYIKIKAATVWGDKPQPLPRVKLTPEEARERRRERDRQRGKTRQRKEAMKAYRAQHREAINARRRERREKQQHRSLQAAKGPILWGGPQ